MERNFAYNSIDENIEDFVFPKVSATNGISYVYHLRNIRRLDAGLIIKAKVRKQSVDMNTENGR